MILENIILSPHDDDNALFAAFTCMREKPTIVVCTDAYIQDMRGEKGCDAQTRADETARAAKILGCDVVRLGIPDHLLTIERLVKEIHEKIEVIGKVYAPALQGGNPHHDIVYAVAKARWPEKVIFYTTYEKTQLYTTGDIEVIPTQDELLMKNQALACYVSQINLPATRPHFEAIKNKSEWLLKLS